MNKGKVIVAAPVHEVLIEGLVAAGYHCELHEHITQAIAPDVIKDCVGIITSTRLMLDSDLINAAPALEWIGRMGSGMEVIDTGYASQKGIKCYSSPEGNANAVAEHAVGMLLDITRRISYSNQELKQGIWKRNENRGTELEGKTIGIIGFGHTGRALARKLQGFDMHILAYDKNVIPADNGLAIPCATLDRIYKEADIVSFHVPQQPDTRYYFSDEFVNNMNKKFILLNTSRGQVVDTLALLRGMKERSVTGACLDVFESEPLTGLKDDIKIAMSILLAHPYVIATPHIAGYTYEALYKMSKILLDKVIG